MTNWVAIWNKQVGVNPTNRETRELHKLELQPAQAAWSLKKYRKVTAYPNVKDFIGWLDDAEPPNEVVAAAFINGQPVVVEMAQLLQTLQASWYPTPETKIQIHELEKKLKAAL